MQLTIFVQFSALCFHLRVAAALPDLSDSFRHLALLHSREG